MNYAQGAIIGSANALKGAYQGSAQSAPRVVNPSAFGTIDAARADVLRVADRLHAVVERLIGYNALTGASIADDAAKVPAANGLLNDAMFTARDISEQCQRMDADLSRLEECLP